MRTIIIILLFLSGGLFYFQLQEIQYPDDPRSATVTYQKEKYSPGYNLYNLRNENTVNLIDREGRLVNSWNIKEILGEGKQSYNYKEGIHFSKLDQDKNLYVIVQARKLLKLSWSGEVILNLKINAHHDVAIAEDQSFYTFNLSSQKIEFNGRTQKVLVDDLEYRSKDGELMQSFPLYDHLNRFLTKGYLFSMMNRRGKENFLGDILHVNSLFILERDIPGVAKAGDLLISVRNLNRLVIFSPKLKKIVWTYTHPSIYQQHSPVVTHDNMILLFDNGSVERGYSRLIKIDPKTREIVWKFDRQDLQFYTRTIGGVQELSNGNILFTTGREHHVFEISGKDVVWGFMLDPKYMDQKSHVQNFKIYRMERYNIDL